MIEARRKFLALAGIAPFALLTAAQAPDHCYDPKTLTLIQKNQRRSLGYIEKSDDAQKHCGTCSFFLAHTEGCGTCQLMSGGPVDLLGVCSSFARKP